jgi:hypothetical protein
VTVNIYLTGCISGDGAPTAQLIATDANGTPLGSGNSNVFSTTKNPNSCLFTVTITAPNPTGNYRVQVSNLGAYGPTVLLAKVVHFTTTFCADSVCATFARGVSAACNCLTIGFWKNQATCNSCHGANCGATDLALAGPSGSAPITFGSITISATACYEALWILSKSGNGQSPADNAVYNMAAQLLGAILNTRAGPCVSAVSVGSVSGGGGACSSITGSTATISSLIACGDSLLSTVGFTCSNPTGSNAACSWSGSLTPTQQAAFNALNDALDSYNNGRAAPGTPSVCGTPGYITSQACY